MSSAQCNDLVVNVGVWITRGNSSTGPCRRPDRCCSPQSPAKAKKEPWHFFCRVWMTHRVVHGVRCEDVEEGLLPANTNTAVTQNPAIIHSSEPGASLTSCSCTSPWKSRRSEKIHSLILYTKHLINSIVTVCVKIISFVWVLVSPPVTFEDTEEKPVLFGTSFFSAAMQRKLFEAHSKNWIVYAINPA